ncbi:hypothetical protein GCM10017778_69250 [Streptomyces vinaceus]|nr:hypothetical protein GCM10017778_69250 [Streptomyces vinaceus]
MIRTDPDKPVHGNRSHLSFGAGAHECPGQDLGRAIAETGIDLLLERLPDVTLSIPDDQLQVVGTWTALADGAGAGAGAPAGVLVPGAERRERQRPHPALRPRFRNRWRGASRCSRPCCRPGSR